MTGLRSVAAVGESMPRLGQQLVVHGLTDADWRAAVEAKTMTPSRLQAPPRKSGVAHSVTAGPPDTSILLSLPSAKNPRDCPSGS